MPLGCQSRLELPVSHSFPEPHLLVSAGSVEVGFVGKGTDLFGAHDNGIFPVAADCRH